MKPVRSMRSPMGGWFGGKNRLAKTIIPLIPEHYCYVEPFAGAAWVYFKKPPSPIEVLNDLNGELMAVYQTLADDPAFLVERAKYALHSRRLFRSFSLMSDEEIAGLSRKERAWRFFYLIHSSLGGVRCFAGLPEPAYAGSAKEKPLSPPSFILRRTRTRQTNKYLRMIAKPVGKAEGRIAGANRRIGLSILEACHERLKDTIIEALPWQDCIARYDGPATFFYIDPPYLGYERNYGANMFPREQFNELAQVLANLKGRFILSLNDCAEVAELFAAFSGTSHMKRVPVCYTMNTKKTRRATELLIANFQLED